MGKTYTKISTIIANTIINKWEDNKKVFFWKTLYFLKIQKKKSKKNHI